MTVSIFSRPIARLIKDPARHLLCPSERKSFGRNGLIWLVITMLLNCPLMAQVDKRDATAIASQTKKPVELPIRYADVLYRSGGKQDPFFNPLLVKKQDKKPEDEEISRGLPPPGIAGTFIAQATLQGIAIREGGRVAVIRGSDSRAYFLKVGDKLFDGYLKDIQNDSVTLVRETRLRSGKVLTQDVTKRLRTP